MPSISIVYTPNLAGEFDVDLLSEAMSAKARELDVFPVWGIRVFVSMADAASVADGDSELGYVQVSVRIAPGRSEELQEKITAELFAELQNQLGGINTRKLGYAIDLTEFKRHSYKSGGSLPGSPTA